VTARPKKGYRLGISRIPSAASASFFCTFWIFIFGGCTEFSSHKHDPSIEIPRPQREFRAAWVATVSNINWPRKPGLSGEEQKQHAISILDTLHACRFNAVILQVRPQCDALYPSTLEPWSQFLTGKQGQPPEPFYDPLKFWIEQAHDRGLELHAWFNPYRAHTGKEEPSEKSVVKTHPELTKRLANGLYWLDPSLKQTQDYSWNVVMDVVRRYDVDGIHFDDYFYPYPSYNDDKDFPDDDSWQAYQLSGGRLSRNDWRRHSVDTFIKRIYTGIKKEKPYVKFGVSPFGIWRPGYPESISGLDQYNVLYADAKLWLNKGWVDYYTPQLYWPIEKIPQSFPVLLGWWSTQNYRQRHLWPGIRVSHGPTECINQIMITRGMQTNNPGVVHWHVGILEKEDGQLAKALQDGPYTTEALPPASPWLDNKAPARPQAELTGKNYIRFWHPDSNDVFRWVIYVNKGEKWQYHLLNRNARNFTVPSEPPCRVGVSAVDRTGNESEIVFVAIAPY
jgi:uncharacterized lipoprotein YddW (UPF0748 family)